MAPPKIIRVKGPGNFRRAALAIVARHTKARMALAMEHVASVARLSVNRGQPVRKGTMGRVGLAPSAPGEPPKKLTGKLQRSIRGKVSSEGRTIRGILGANTAYARALEYGVDKDVIVGAHLRRVDKVFGRKLAKEIYVQIPFHKRRMKLEARPYLRPAIIKSRRAIAEILRYGR